MEIAEFTTAVTGLFDFFRMPQPDSKVITGWYRSEYAGMPVSRIPGAAMRFITDRIKDMDNLPRNLVKVMVIAWKEFQSANHAPPVQKTRCDNCESTGLIWFRVFRYGFPYRFVGRCPMCNNGNLPGAQVVTADFLRQVGGELC